MGFDTQGHGHAIIAINNPDTANNVITYVPGTGAGLDGGDFPTDVDRSDGMVLSANNASLGTQTTSSITWVGYDAPQSIPHAESSDYAKNAETSLHNFETGLRQTHEGAPSRNTIIGHSYGSTTVGFTMRNKGLPVDNVIFVGSPGVGVEHASDLGINPSHVYVGVAANDPVVIGADLLGTAAYEQHNADRPQLPGDLHGIFGRDPSVPQFGANNLPANPGNPVWKFWKTSAHSQYCTGVPRSLDVMRRSGDKDDDLRRVAPVGERSSGRTSGPFTDFSLPPELRCWFILSSVTPTRQHSTARWRASRSTPTCPRPRCMTLTCYDASP